MRHTACILSLAAILSSAGALTAGAQGMLQTATQAVQAGPAAAAEPDALGRATPAGTVMGFLAAGARADWERASRYLDTKLPGPRAEELAQQLKVLLDRGLTINLDRLSRKPEGEQDERFGKDRESIGTIERAAGRLDVVLVRVHYGAQPAIWLFSPETLRDVPAVYGEFEPSFLEGYLPRSFTRGYGVRYMWWTWFVMLGAALAAFGAAMAATGLLRWVARLLLDRLSRGYVWSRWAALTRPVRWMIFGIVMRILSGSFLTLRQRFLGARIATIFVIAAVTWVIIKVLGSSVGRWSQNLERQASTERVALVRLVGRLLQATAIVIGALALLQAVGINLTPVLAGLGVGGIAVALASQKTLENLFGGMMVISDSPVRIGNYCRVGTLSGTVEDIGLRSTRIRTLARTTISIPNADLASQSIENFATRDKMLFTHTVVLRYETTADQLRFILAEARALLYRHEKVETSSARVRLLRFAASGLEVELFAYLLATEFEAFLAIQEDLLLRLVDIIESSGSALAFPSQTMYFTRDEGVDLRRAAEAEAAVREWRERGTLPFPDLPEDEKTRLQGGVEYPPRASALRGDAQRT